MWSAFITGAANKATELIEKRDKDIQDIIESQLTQMYKRATEAQEDKEVRLNELRELKTALESSGFNSQEITHLLKNKTAATTAVKLIEARKLKGGQVTRAHLDSLLKGEMPKISKVSQTPEEFIAAQTTLQEGPTLLGTEMRGAFGLSTEDAQQRAFARVGRQTGMGEEDLRKTKLPLRASEAVSLDYSAFAPEQDFADRKNKAQIALLEADPGSDEFRQASRTLSKIAAIEDIGKSKEDKLKESDVRSNLRNLDNTIKEAMAGPGNLVRISNPDGSFSYGYKKGLKPDVIRAIENARQNAFTNYLREFYSDEGKIPDVVRRAAAPFLVSPGVPVKTGGGEETPRPQTTPTPPAAAGGMPAPKTQKEYDDLPSGTRYIDMDGKIKIKS